MGKAIGPTVLRLRTGQVALLLIALLGIGALAGWSVYSSTPHQVEKLAILAESNDAASLAYSQRESFNLAISLEKWVRK
jgi:predicted negative regulator of RcsB-dependent stress response